MLIRQDRARLQFLYVDTSLSQRKHSPPPNANMLQGLCDTAYKLDLQITVYWLKVALFARSIYVPVNILHLICAGPSAIIIISYSGPYMMPTTNI